MCIFDDEYGSYLGGSEEDGYELHQARLKARRDEIESTVYIVRTILRQLASLITRDKERSRKCLWDLGVAKSNQCKSACSGTSKSIHDLCIV